MQAELIVDCRNAHGEGVFWNHEDQKVWWTDIAGKALWWFEPASGQSGSLAMPDRVCAFAPRAGGGMVLAFADGLALLDGEGRMTRIEDFEPDNDQSRLNDGRTDRCGRFVVGGMNEGDGRADSSVIRLDPDGTVTTLIRDVAISNSICFSPDGGTMYFTDTPTRRIIAYPYNQQTGTLGEARLFADLADEPGFPDGSCVDADGGVWNTQWDGYRVVRFTSDGAKDVVVELPVGRVSCCAFGGPELDTLYITTSRQGADEAILAKEPTSGGLFAVKPGRRGVVDTPFAG